MVKYNISGHMYHHNQRWELGLPYSEKKKKKIRRKATWKGKWLVALATHHLKIRELTSHEPKRKKKKKIKTKYL